MDLSNVIIQFHRKGDENYYAVLLNDVIIGSV